MTQSNGDWKSRKILNGKLWKLKSVCQTYHSLFWLSLVYGDVVGLLCMDLSASVSFQHFLIISIYKLVKFQSPHRPLCSVVYIILESIDNTIYIRGYGHKMKGTFFALYIRKRKRSNTFALMDNPEYWWGHSNKIYQHFHTTFMLIYCWQYCLLTKMTYSQDLWVLNISTIQ